MGEKVRETRKICKSRSVREENKEIIAHEVQLRRHSFKDTNIHTKFT